MSDEQFLAETKPYAQERLEASLSDLALENSRLHDQLRECRAETACLVERLRHAPDMRAVVVELRGIRDNVIAFDRTIALKRLTDLLRRLDESQ